MGRGQVGGQVGGRVDGGVGRVSGRIGDCVDLAALLDLTFNLTLLVLAFDLAVPG